jgi:hypothetical protein
MPGPQNQLPMLATPQTNPSQLESNTNDTNTAISAYNTTPSQQNKDVLCDSLAQLLGELNAQIASLQAAKDAVSQMQAEAGCFT